MNKKRLFAILTVLFMVLVLTGCASPRDAEGNIKLIYLDTPYSTMKEEGIFAAILIYPLAQAINFLSDKLHSCGAAVVVVTLILNALVLALTFKSNMDLQKMQQLQPEQARIQKKYEGRDDQASRLRMSQEMNKLYEKYDVKPGRAMLSTFLQFPILIAMYNAVQRSAAVATGHFLGIDLSLTPMANLSNGVYMAVVIYALMLILQFLSISLPRWLSERRAKAEAERHHRHYEKPANQNMMMSYSMLIFIGVLMINWPSALTLYYCIYSAVNVIKTFVVDGLTNKEA